MVITILYNDNNGCDYHRLLLPTKHIELREGDSIRIVHHRDCLKDEEVFKCDILFFSRLLFFDWEILNRLRRKYGFKIIVDIDDYNRLDYNHLIYKSWKEHGIENRILEACSNADLVFVTNEQLHKVYKEVNTNVLIIPNALPFEDCPTKIDSDKIRFMYVSGSTHYNDLRLLTGLFQRLRSDGDFKRKATFTLCGYNNPKNQRENIWNKMESICKINGSFIRRETLPLESYMEHYRHGDISIAPLENTFFNNCKSNLKFIEAATMKHPFICSNVLPYIKDYCDGSKVSFCYHTKDWYQAFKFFINNPNAIEDYGNKNFEYAKRHYNIKDANILRTQAFKNLI